MKRLVVFTGAGVSAESGIKTFRDSDGLWEQYRIEDVATPEAFARNPEMVLNFYNERRKQVIAAKPNMAHLALVALENYFKTNIITQNIDDLHERAGSINVLHLHGEIMKARSCFNETLIYELEKPDIKLGDNCEKGFQLRPHIVWFGEMVPEMERAAYLASMADILIVIGSSLEVYPAAGLVNYAPEHAIKYLIDPKAKELNHISNLTVIRETAGEAVPLLVKKLIKNPNAA
jgi:NAD-dependent deacetylase